MNRIPCAAFGAALAVLASWPAMAEDTLQETPVAAKKATEADTLREQMRAMRAQFEAQMQALEQRLADVEARQADTATPTPAPVAANAFNPQIAVVLNGTASNLSQDPTGYRLQGFFPGGDETGPGERSFSLGESEMTLSANVDPYFFGQVTLSVAADDSVSAEEAFMRTTALPAGFTVTAGRFYSGLGYVNSQHAHAWDFVDAPLVYQAFFGGQYKNEGAQVRWLAPTDTYLEFGAELGNGQAFPGNDRNKNGINATTLFATTGGDIGDSASWKATLSYLRNASSLREYEDTDHTGSPVLNAFSGDSDTWGLAAVYKWAPNGNALRTNLTLQGEYFRRHDNGTLIHDVPGLAGGTAWAPYNATQAGWYVQGVYQFMPHWRAGLRYDQLLSGDGNVNALWLNPADFSLLDGHNPSRSSVMVDYTPSEFSRIRLQFANDDSRADATDHQIYLQYTMSLGAHGAHTF